MPLGCQIVVLGLTIEFLAHHPFKEFIHETLVHNCLSFLKRFKPQITYNDVTHRPEGVVLSLRRV